MSTATAHDTVTHDLQEGVVHFTPGEDGIGVLRLGGRTPHLDRPNLDAEIAS